MANGGGGGGGCYTTIRELPEDHDIEISECKIAVRLAADSTVKYDFDYIVRGTPACKPHQSFWFLIPNPLEKLNDFLATDTTGSLEWSREDMSAGANRKTKFKIRYRDEMRPGRTEHLHFSFQNAASVVVSKQLMRTVMVFTDYVSHTVDCDYVAYDLMPPPGYRLLESPFSAFSPLRANDSTGSAGSMRAEFHHVESRSPIPIQATLCTEPRVGKQFWRSAFLLLLAAEISAVFGVMSASAQWPLALVPAIPLVGVGMATLALGR